MLRLSFIVLGLLFITLFLLSLLPKKIKAIPDEAIKLANAKLILYPQEDEEAVWNFESPKVEYKADNRETVLYDIKNAARRVKGEVDFSIESDKVVIASDDNIWGDHIKAHIVGEKDDPEDDYWLDMSSKNGRQVLINQRSAEFEIPHVKIIGEGSEQVFEDFFIDFALENFRAGGEGTVGYASFELEDNQ